MKTIEQERLEISSRKLEGNFHAKMGTIKDRNGMDLTEAEAIQKRCQEHTAAAAKSLQLCLTLCDPIDGSPPGSTVPGILQARTQIGRAHV